MLDDSVEAYGPLGFASEVFMGTDCERAVERVLFLNFCFKC